MGLQKKKIVVGLLLSFFSFSVGTTAWAADELQLIIDNQLYMQSGQQTGPMLLDDRVYVPLRLVGESLGYQVGWSEIKRQVHIADVNSTLNLTGDGVRVAEDTPVTIWLNGEALVADETLGAPFIAENGQTMVPLRLVGEALRCNVQWQDGVVIVEKRAEILPAEAEKEQNETVDVKNKYYTLTIQGDSVATAAQLNDYLQRKEDDVRAMMKRNYPDREFLPFPENIAELYIEIGKKYNIRGDLAFAQALKETGYFQFYGSVQDFQNNFCGLGASGVENTGEEALNGADPYRVYSIPGLHGLSFLTVADGVEAHIQHLYAYASKEPLPEGCDLLDSRFVYVKRGIAERWIDLNGRWAVPGNGYGESIIDDYWMPAIQE